MGKGLRPTAGKGGASKDDVEGGFIYVEDILVAYTDPWLIHSVFNTLKGLFGQVGLQKNF